MAFDYAALCGFLERLYRAYGVLPRVIGRTALGRAVFALDVGQTRPRSLLLGGITGDAGADSETLLRFADALLHRRQEGLPFFGVDPAAALRESGVTVVPCLNPDGLELFVHGPASAGSLRRFVSGLFHESEPWRANARGVDLRHQFGCGFDAYRATAANVPGAFGFCGKTPQSEAESHALALLCRRERFRHATVLQPGEAQVLVHAASDPQTAALCSKLLAQELCVPPQTATQADGGFPFWFSEALRRPAYTVQTGKGTDPLPETMLFSCLLLSVLL